DRNVTGVQTCALPISLQAARIVADLLTTFAPDREQVFFCIDAFHARIFSGFDALRLAAFRVAYDVGRFILLGPLTVCAGDLLACDEIGRASCRERVGV